VPRRRLSCREAIGLDDECIAEFAGSNRRQRIGCGGAHAITGGRNAVALHEILRKRLARFKLRSAPGRPEHAPALGLESIRQPVSERGFRSDDGQIDLLAIDEPNHGVGVQYVDRRSRDGSRNPGVAGRADDVS
jgi:hypothetical protein